MKIDIVPLAVLYNGQNRKGRSEDHLGVPAIHHPLSLIYRAAKWGIIEPTPENYDFYMGLAYHDVPEDFFPSVQSGLEYLAHNRILNERSLRYVAGLSHDPKIMTKAEYMKTFFDKEVEVLIAKTDDRLCNVEDFLWSKPDYALKYFLKASDLLEALDRRSSEVVQRFGQAVWENINRDISDIGLRVNTIPRC